MLIEIEISTILTIQTIYYIICNGIGRSPTSHSFGERLRNRVQDLVKFSRPSLFGRLIRVPSLLPFKRHQTVDNNDDDESSPPGFITPLTGRLHTTIGASRLRKDNKTKNDKRPLSRRERRTRLKDRQLININGQQFYLDDDNTLKQINK